MLVKLILLHSLLRITSLSPHLLQVLQKTSLVQLIPRLYDVTEGELLVGGVNVKDYKIFNLRDAVSMVLQKNVLFSGTVRENLQWGNENATDEELWQALEAAQAKEFVEEKEGGLDAPVLQNGKNFSGGQRQRLSIARAILKNPPILILDEATSALDTESERLVQEALERLMKNRTTLVIAHRLSTIINADMICVMHQGQIVERGTHDQLLALNGYYKRLVDMQKF